MAMTPERKEQIISRMRKAFLLYSDDEKKGLAPHYILEGVDDQHRDKAQLNAKYLEWEKTPDVAENQSFWVWLDATHPAFSEAQGVTYVNKKQRGEYKINIDKDGTIRRGNGTEPYDTLNYGGKTPGMAAYVMDKEGNIYVGEHQTGIMHHSSFLAGKPVVSAGMVKIESGKITQIDHRSGHYSPTKENFENALGKIDQKAFAPQAKLEISGNIKSEMVQKIAHSFITINDNRYFNWLPSRTISAIVQYGRHLEHNNQKTDSVSAVDYYAKNILPTHAESKNVVVNNPISPFPLSSMGNTTAEPTLHAPEQSAAKGNVANTRPQENLKSYYRP